MVAACWTYSYTQLHLSRHLPKRNKCVRLGKSVVLLHTVLVVQPHRTDNYEDEDNNIKMYLRSSALGKQS